jgi:molecular chaperone Hsp33
MPQAGERLAAEVEDRILKFPSLGDVFTTNQGAETVVQDVFGQYEPRFLATRRVEFMCHCNRDRLRRMLSMLPIDDLKDLRDNGPFPLEMPCRNCNTSYSFSREEIQEVYGMRYPNS